MSQDMSPSLGVVHQCLDTPYNGCVDTTLWGLIVHALQEVQQTAQAIQLNKPGHKPGKKNNQQTTKQTIKKKKNKASRLANNGASQFQGNYILSLWPYCSIAVLFVAVTTTTCCSPPQQLLHFQGGRDSLKLPHLTYILIHTRYIFIQTHHHTFDFRLSWKTFLDFGQT